MLTFICLTLAICLGLVAAAVIIMVVATSDWYIERCKETTKSWADDYFKW